MIPASLWPTLKIIMNQKVNDHLWYISIINVLISSYDNEILGFFFDFLAFDDNEDKYQDRMFIDKDDPNATKIGK